MALEKENQNLIPRPPIVVIMGHIDHGKTTLLDYIRKTKITEKESGGITQHIGAYEVEFSGKKITFLDTPGHEAFSKIRKRGAKVADIAVLIIAADEGVKPQTEEALNAINEAGIPFIVAINKIDKENANPEKIKKELGEKNVILEEWGGKIPAVNISAKTGAGVNDLLEMILLVAEMEELKTNFQKPASGVILESHKDPKRGIAATLLIRDGFLKKGMYVVAQNAVSPVRIFEDFLGRPINESRASSPVVVIGFDKLPEVGARFLSFDSKKTAEEFASRKEKDEKITNQNHLEKISIDKEDDKEEKENFLSIIIKADVVGSKEAIEKSITDIFLKNGLNFKILRSEVGDISEDDIKLASSAKKAAILGFKVKFPQVLKPLAERYDIEIKLFDIIYEIENWLEEKLEKIKKSAEKETIIGEAKILKIFSEDKNQKIIGGEVVKGKVTKGNIKIFRRNLLLGEGKIIELRKYQTRVEEISEKEQFGALIQTKISLAVGDIVKLTKSNQN